jgi:hypothetical protein
MEERNYPFTFLTEASINLAEDKELLIQDFIEKTNIPVTMLSILQAFPNTALWQRLEKEGRLVDGRGFVETGDQSDLMNFIPSRPIDEIAREYLQTNRAIYEPTAFLKRCLRQCLNITSNPRLRQSFHFHLAKGMRIATQLMWKQGWQRPETRWLFWRQLLTILTHKPQALNLYLALCACGEHFWEYSDLRQERIIQKLGYNPLDEVSEPKLIRKPVAF